MQPRFSKMYKISRRNVSPSAGVLWHGSFDDTRCTSHFIRILGKTLRATQSANLNLEMTEILYQLGKIDLFGNPGLQLKCPSIWKLRNLPSMNILSNYLPRENVIFMVIFHEINWYRQIWKNLRGYNYGTKFRTFPGISPWWFKEILVIFWLVNDNTFLKNLTDPIDIKAERYLVWRFHIDAYSSKVSVHNVFTVKVVTNRRDLRQKHHDVLPLTLSSKNVLFETAISIVKTRDLTNRWSRVIIFR